MDKSAHQHITTPAHQKMDIAALITIMQDELRDASPGSITPETPFRQLEGWNSMMALIIISRIDNDWGVSLSAKDMADSTTVKDIFSALQSIA